MGGSNEISQAVNHVVLAAQDVLTVLEVLKRTLLLNQMF